MGRLQSIRVFTRIAAHKARIAQCVADFITRVTHVRDLLHLSFETETNSKHDCFAH